MPRLFRVGCFAAFFGAPTPCQGGVFEKLESLTNTLFQLKVGGRFLEKYVPSVNEPGGLRTFYAVGPTRDFGLAEAFVSCEGRDPRTDVLIFEDSPPSSGKCAVETSAEMHDRQHLLVTEKIPQHVRVTEDSAKFEGLIKITRIKYTIANETWSGSVQERPVNDFDVQSIIKRRVGVGGSARYWVFDLGDEYLTHTGNLRQDSFPTIVARTPAKSFLSKLFFFFRTKAKHVLYRGPLNGRLGAWARGKHSTSEAPLAGLHYVRPHDDPTFLQKNIYLSVVEFWWAENPLYTLPVPASLVERVKAGKWQNGPLRVSGGKPSRLSPLPRFQPWAPVKVRVRSDSKCRIKSNGEKLLNMELSDAPFRRRSWSI